MNEIKIMAVLNITPDSFSDGGKFNEAETALKQAKKLIKQGADILDVGAESSGPGSKTVTDRSEFKRLKPIIEKFQAAGIHKQVTLSIDTYKANIADYALQNGFTIVNDVTGLRADKQMAATIAKYDAKVVIMYSKDPTARTTKKATDYKNIIKTISEFLKKQTNYAIKQGIKPENIIIDPGMGAFLSTKPEYSWEVINRLAELKPLGFPILVGTSRKSFLGGPLEDRDIPTLIADTIATYNGADVLRVHAIQNHKYIKSIQNNLAK